MRCVLIAADPSGASTALTALQRLYSPHMTLKQPSGYSLFDGCPKIVSKNVDLAPSTECPRSI